MFCSDADMGPIDDVDEKIDGQLMGTVVIVDQTTRCAGSQREDWLGLDVNNVLFCIEIIVFAAMK